MQTSVALLSAILLSAPIPARAFCGFFVSGANQKLYNNASHVVLMRKGNRTVMTMSNHYKGPPADFAMVVPVPVVLQKKQVTEYAWDTGSCDPCPGPPLDESDLETLGSSRLGGDTGAWVVTRLHTRYDKQTLSEDLVFKTARPMKGGRGDREDGGGPQTASKDESNNFQGRYIIRHYWAKKLACEHPQRNVWGGPPDGREERFTTARDLADVPRGSIQLSEVVKTPVPALGLTNRKKK